MNINTSPRRQITVTRKSLLRSLALIFSVAYGAFIVYALQLQFSVGSGDISSYIYYFEVAGNTSETVVISADYVFRIAIFAINDYFNIPVLEILSYFAFVCSSIVIYIFLINIRSEKYLIYLFPLLLMIFLTPNVQILFSSGIRSGIAFTLLMLGFVMYKGFLRYLLFLGASIIHLSMLPMLALYFFYNFLNHRRVGSPILLSLVLLFIASSIMAILATNVYFTAVVATSAAYNIMLLYFTLIIIFLNRKVLKDHYGFIAVGLMFIYLAGVFIDASFIRYVGNSILLFLFFLIRRGDVGTIQTFTVAYIPFFLLTLSYSIANSV
tara:strand:+ start:470 stop:1441 length:972 start_codon:yes stop_codon:yes gene_type:complete